MNVPDRTHHHHHRLRETLKGRLPAVNEKYFQLASRGISRSDPKFMFYRFLMLVDRNKDNKTE